MAGGNRAVEPHESIDVNITTGQLRYSQVIFVWGEEGEDDRNWLITFLFSILIISLPSNVTVDKSMELKMDKINTWNKSVVHSYFCSICSVLVKYWSVYSNFSAYLQLHSLWETQLKEKKAHKMNIYHSFKMLLKTVSNFLPVSWITFIHFLIPSLWRTRPGLIMLFKRVVFSGCHMLITCTFMAVVAVE